MQELYDAIRNNDPAAIERLLEADPSLVSARSGETSAILYAVYHGHPEIARLFVDKGASLSFAEAIALGEGDRVKEMLARDPTLANSFSDDGYPSLGLAIFFRHPEIARHLVELGADVNAPARNAQKVAPIHAAAAVGDREMVRFLLERGANANARQQQGFAAIHTAAQHGDIEMATDLVKHGADPAAAADNGQTPADFAREKGKQDFVDWLASNRK
jgi:ankyrin repeat protein